MRKNKPCIAGLGSSSYARPPRVHDKRELYLRGLSTGDFQQALSAWLGEEAIAGFSATTITRLLFVWQDEYKAWRKQHWPLPMAP